MRFLSLLFLALLISSCAVVQPAARTESTLPEGWKIYSKTRPSQVALYCTRYGGDWEVSIKDGHVVIKEPVERIGWKKDLMSFRGGTLRGEYHGEWGSNLWWTSADGKINSKIFNEYVYGVENTADGVLIFAQSIYSLDNAGPLPPKPKMLKPYGGYYFKDPSGNFIILTDDSIFRFNPNGESKKIFTPDYKATFTNSVAEESSGIIYIGMRHFVTRLTPVGDSYKEDWLIPEDSADCPLPAECPKYGFPDCKCVKHSDFKIQSSLRMKKN